MSASILKQIVGLVKQAQVLAAKLGIKNILQPGLVKEMIVADILGHELIHSKHDSDACAPGAPHRKYEYLSCLEGGTGQLDRMFKSPKEKRQTSLERITRNEKVYLAIFFKKDPLTVKAIYELDPRVVLAKTNEALDNSSNAISHVGFTENWARQNGKVVYQAK